jgi:threonine dehydrogenase-like Zn-dependent dehydrogenase
MRYARTPRGPESSCDGVKALVWHGGRELALEDLPEPVPAAGEVLLDVTLAGICGSDLHPFRGHAGPRTPPLVLGHEVVGTVEGLAGRYAVYPLVVCGACPACLRGEENLCERRALLGLHRPGVFADRTAVPQSALHEVPDSVDDSAATLVEPLAVCVGALRPFELTSADTVLVVGCGPIGLLCVAYATTAGARVIAIEPLATRQELARLLGAAEVARSTAEMVPGAADVAVDAVGLEVAWRSAIAGVRSGGNVVLLGLGQDDGAMPVADLVRRGVSVTGHFAYTRDDFADALALLAAGRIRTDWLEVMPLRSGPEAFARLVDEPGRATKILLEPAHD